MCWQGPVKACGDSWMSPINRQFSNMGLLVSQNRLLAFPSVIVFRLFSQTFLRCMLTVAFCPHRAMIPPVQILIWTRKWMWIKDVWAWMITTATWGREEEAEGLTPTVQAPLKRWRLEKAAPTTTRWRHAVTSQFFCVSCLFCQFHFVFSHCSLFPSVVFPPLSSLFLLPPPPLKLVFHWLSLWQALPLTNQDWCLGEEGPCSLYSPPTVYKPHSLFNHTIPFRQVR